VSNNSQEEAVWCTWVFAAVDISNFEKYLCRLIVDVPLVKLDCHDLSWKQIRVLRTLKDRGLPFFIGWKKNAENSSKLTN
jgi:hypothetical protein